MKPRYEVLRDMKKRKKRFINILPSIRSIFTGKSLFIVMFILLFIVSIFFYTQFEFLSQGPYQSQAGESAYFQAFYWLVTTATTVGYGDITPTTMEGKILALVVMVLGVSLLGFLITQLTKSIVESNIGKLFGLNRIRSSIEYIICGWNDLSKAAFEEVNNFKNSIIIISKTRPEIDFSKNVQFMNGDPQDKTILENANIKKAKNVLLCMDSDSEILLAIHIIRELNPWINITAKMNDPEYIPMAESAGADQVVAPSAISGRLLSIVPEQPYVVKWFLGATSTTLNEKFIEYIVGPKSVFAGKTLDLIRQSSNIKIIGVESTEGFEKLPKDDYEIKIGDKLIVLFDTLPK